MTFVNTTPYPLYIAAFAREGMVQIRLFGLPVEEEVRLLSQVVCTRPYRDVDTQGHPLADTHGYRLVRAGEEGVTARLVRLVGAKREVIRECTYPPQNAVWQC